MLRQRLVDFTETLVISGNSDVKQLVAVTELAACNGFDAISLAFEDKINDSHCIVDVGQSHRRNMQTPRPLHQTLNGDSAEAQTVI